MTKDRMETIKEFRDDIASMQSVLVDIFNEEYTAYNHHPDKDGESGRAAKMTVDTLDNVTYDLEIIWQYLEELVNAHEEKTEE